MAPLPVGVGLGHRQTGQSFELEAASAIFL